MLAGGLPKYEGIEKLTLALPFPALADPTTGADGCLPLEDFPAKADITPPSRQ